MIEQYHELRYIETSPQNTGTFSSFEDVDERLTLIDLVKQYDYIFLLGNPGVGKTTELKAVFKKLWQDKQDTQLVPLLINIKNFRYTYKIEDLILFENWQQMPALIFLFDGLDEIGNIRDFIAELQNFIERYPDLKLKFIISCRTNIYQKYLTDLKDFTTAYLKNLSYNQIENILDKKYNLQLNDETITSSLLILQTPFFLNLFANYYIKNGSFPDTLEKSWDLMLNEAINDTLDKLKNRFDTNKAHINHMLQTVAIANELMQKTIISEEHLYKLVGANGIKIFPELNFISKDESLENYSFIHKNYQEYYAARFISHMSSEEIIEFIKAVDLEKVKPNLFNTTTFLLSILKAEKFRILKNWLLTNDIEILFFADENRFDEELKNEIFEKYFREICIEKTYWINNNEKLSLNILAEFANFDFLIDQLTNKELHFRGRASSLEVLAYKSLNERSTKVLKEQLLSLLINESGYLTTEILRTIRTHGLHRDSNYLNEVLSYTKFIENKDVYYEILSIESDLPDGTRDSELFLELVRKYYTTYDSVIRATDYLFASTLLKTEDADFNLALLEIMFDEKYSFRANSVFLDNFDDRILERIEFFGSDPNYILKLIDIAFSGSHRIMSNPLLQKILLKIKLTPEIVTYILLKERLSTDVLYQISNYLDKGLIDHIIGKYMDGTFKFDPDENIEKLRNWIANNNWEAGIYFELRFTEAGFVFSTPLLTEIDASDRQTAYNNFRSKNFQLLFDKTALVTEIQNYFINFKVDKLSNKEFRPLFIKWYNDLNFHGIQYTVHAVLETAFRLYPRIILDISRIVQLLDEPYFYLSVIKSCLGHSSFDKDLKEPQLSLIRTLVEPLVGKIDFNNIIIINPTDPNRFSTTINFAYLKLVLFYDLRYNILLDKDFYLNAIEFGDAGQEKHPNSNSSFIAHVLERTNDRQAVNERVTENINKGNLTFFSKVDHICYAIDNNLDQCFEKIGEEILLDDTLFNQSNILTKYIEIIDDPLSFLKECCREPKSYFYWHVIKIIKENEMDNEFILEASLNYLENQDLNFISDAVNILFYLNHNKALHYYFNSLERLVSLKSDSSGFFPKDVIKYKNLNELDLYESLFNLIYKPSAFQAFYLYQSRNFMNALTANLSMDDQAHHLVINKLLGIKAKIEMLQDKDELDHKIFYINALIDFSNNSHLKSKSTELTFDEAVTIIGRHRFA
ncbi:NACHT domain-containing protein [Chryseobacterium camelliae]|uniref:NACHT domain-containing protein n=1 Tax=Chryseobacterium camelliae TaxID=1265445 RepID=UPI002860B875|nr:AAA family ATPase [Chryseobacterium camelliae]MDR6513689.1 hypothetical protein [Chryseobacterium camelliae]